MVKRTFVLLIAVLVLIANNAWSEGDWSLQRKAVDFDRCSFLNSETASKIKAAGNLSGRTEAKDNSRAQGWVDYDFNIPTAGWYEILASPSVNNQETSVDGTHYRFCTTGGDKVGNFWLTAGKHTLRLQQYQWFAGLSGITTITVHASAPTIAQTVRVETVNPTTVLRKGERLSLKIWAGGRQQAGTLTAWLRETGNDTVLATYTVPLPPAMGGQQIPLAIPCTREGIFTLTFGDGDRPLSPRDCPPIALTVVDTTLQRRLGGEMSRKLLTEIDCANTAPDYTGGGETRVVKKPFGTYRESNDVGWYGHMNSSEPSWFAYKFSVDEVQRPYLIEVDYPDDALRSYCLAIREGAVASYPTTGGVDSGGEFVLTNQMHTHSIIHWARTKDLRVLCINSTDHMRAAAAKIRIYRIDGDLPLLNVPKTGGRNFANWYEEGSNFMAVYGGPDWRSASMKDYLTTADRWARSVAYMGGDTLWPTLAVYQFGLYPSHYNVMFTGPFSPDLARVILYKCEKYGLRAIFEFHPEARELATPLASETKADDFLVNKDGIDGSKYPSKFSPLHPRTQEWYLGMIGEFADQYKDSPAFAGISLRQMTWCNPTLNNFHSIEWGYEDSTIANFEKETGIHIPVSSDDPRRFTKRYDWLMSNTRERWITWRCVKIAGLFTHIRDRVRQARPDLQVYTGTLSREAGVDPALLNAIPGVTVVNGGSYGRRPDQQPIVTRDTLLGAIRQASHKPDGESSFLFGSQYYEATEVVAPPEQLGFPASTPKTWMSGVVNPAGRQCLERWALALAEDDATFLADGGNAYTLGQPLLREFLNEYRRLPAKPFSGRADSTDPVVVRELRDGKTWYCYAVNRERYPIKVTFSMSGNGTVSYLTTDVHVPLQAGQITFTLAPYELRTFRGPTTLRLSRVSIMPPAEEVARVQAQLRWLEDFNARVARKEVGDRLSTDDMAALLKAATEARAALDKGHLWQARITSEHNMIPVYERANAQPPFLRALGAPVAPPESIRAETLLPRFSTGADVQLIPSTEITSSWTGDTLARTNATSWELSLDVPIDGRYLVTVGHAAGGVFGPVDVSVDGVSLGSLDAPMPQEQGTITMLPKLARLTHGTVKFLFSRHTGTMAAISFIKLTPVYDDILAIRWQRIGPFTGANAQAETAMARVFAPESQHDFTATAAADDGTPLHWVPITAMSDYVDLTAGHPTQAGAINYASTYIYAPSARIVRFSYSMDYWIKLWMNDALVKDFAPHAGGAPVKGQFTVDVPLQAGWNRLLVKVASGSLGNGFWMAVTNPGDLRFSQMVP